MSSETEEFLRERILILAPTSRDASTTQHFFSRAGLRGFVCKNITELCHEFERGAGAMLVTQESILADGMQCLKTALKNQPFWSDCPLIVLTPAGDESRQHTEMLKSVGHTTLIKRPLQVSTLLSVMQASLRDRRRQYHVCELLNKSENQAIALREAVHNAEAASNAKSEFLANMSHEIRTPMNAIVGLSSLLSNAKVTPQKQKEFLNTLQLSAQALLDLINDLLDISKIESENVELENVPFSLKSVVDEITRIMTVRSEEKRIELALEFDPRLQGKFMGDPLRIKQILMNLVGNAIKFTEEGVVTLKLELLSEPSKDASIIGIDVLDTGIGIASDKLEVVFGKFRQADNSITRRYGGTGLGLAITKKLISLMGGSIKVISEEGVGSAFTLTLPLTRIKTNTSIVQKKDATPIINGRVTGKNAPSILLVEDYEANILVAQSTLEYLGYRCKVAHNGKEAIDTLQNQCFDLVLMDIQMPVLDGYSATRIIRQNERQLNGKRTPVLGITAYALDGDRDKCIQAGMDDYIAKPFRPEDLQIKINMLLSKHLQDIPES